MIAEGRMMTTDPDEGRRQLEAMKPEPLKVGDKVRLAAGGERIMTVVAMEDYGNNAVCQWADVIAESFHDKGGIISTGTKRETFPVRSLVRVEHSEKE